jgi:quinohemoprotein ethanol dehydrogenase
VRFQVYDDQQDGVIMRKLSGLDGVGNVILGTFARMNGLRYLLESNVSRPRIGAFLMSCACIVGSLAHGPGAYALESVSADQWVAYGRDSTQQRFSPLDAINVETVKHLGLQWSLDLPNETALVSTPLFVDGTLYFSGNFSVVYAVDPKQGRVKWSYDPKTRETLARQHTKMWVNWGACRGLAYWQNRLYVATADGRLIALSAKTGGVLWSVQTFDPKTPRNITEAPLAFNGKVVIGHGGGDIGPMRGYVTAYDAQNGRQLWRFYTVPGNPAEGFESEALSAAAKTWTGDWWKFGGGGAVWNAMTFDPQFNRVYLGTGNGSPWNAKIRSPLGGDNLYLASIVALDADSGRYVWHYQETPGDAWDYDAAVDMVLADISLEGKARKVLMQASKNGFFYVIDRATGRLISAQPFVPTNWAKSVDMNTGRPVEEPGMRPQAGQPGVTLRPTQAGGHSWPSMSYNPGTGLTYIPALEYDEYYSARDIDPKHWTLAPFALSLGYSDVVGRELEESPPSAIDNTNVDVNQPSAWLQARDPRTNRSVWQVRQPGRFAGGTLTTRGDLVFIGQADGHLAAYDARTGGALWTFDTGRPIAASPITYSVGGVQYISVLVGWGSFPAAEGSVSDPNLRMTYRDGGRRLLTFALDGQSAYSSIPPPTVIPIDVPDFKPDSAKILRGQHIFDEVCSNCHGTNALSGGLAPDLRASHAASDPNTLRAILHGALELRGMPKFYDYSFDDVDAIYQYIRFRAREDIHEREQPAAPR